MNGGQPEVVTAASRQEESGVLGIVGGTTMSTASPLLPYMRAIRHRFQMLGNAGNKTNGGDRFCSGVAVAKNVILTAGHCVELINNAGDYIYSAHHTETTIPYGFGFRRVFFGHMSAAHPLPRYPETSNNYSLSPNYGVVKTSADVTSGTSIRSADIGFLYDWINPAPSIVPLCTEVPAVGQTITVTGLKLILERTPYAANYFLGWGEYQAKITNVYNRPTTVLSLSSPKPAVWNYSSPTFSKGTFSTAMEFVSEALDPVKNCSEGGDSGGGVFLNRADGSKCLLGVNSARGATINLGAQVQCTPTMHRRIIPEMLASLPDTSQMGLSHSFLAVSTESSLRSMEFNTRFTQYPPGLFVPLP
jgi:hypothetical protein